jgi:hypothetical protein
MNRRSTRSAARILHAFGAEDDSAGIARAAMPQVRKGGPPGDRTQNPRIKSPLLCQLS